MERGIKRVVPEADEDDMVSCGEVISQREEVQLDDWGLHCDTLAVIHKPQNRLPNPSYVEEEDEWVDEKFQEDVFIDEEFEQRDEYLLVEVPNFNDEVGYIDFLGIDDILLNPPNNDCDEFYMVDENDIFTRETMTDQFLSIFMACGREKVKREARQT